VAVRLSVPRLPGGEAVVEARAQPRLGRRQTVQNEPAAERLDAGAEPAHARALPADPADGIVNDDADVER
jgi:hypothetical protein